MKNINKNKIKLFKEFIDLCKKENIWYSISGNSLLEIFKNKNLCFLNKKIEIFMTWNSYNELKSISDNVFDSFSEKKSKNFCAFYYLDKNKKNNFIEIQIVIPTNVKKIKKYNSSFYFLKNIIKKKPINTKIIFNDLFEKKYQGFFILNNNKSKIYRYWVQNISFERIPFYIKGLEIFVFKEYQKYLKNIFQEDLLFYNKNKFKL